MIATLKCSKWASSSKFSATKFEQEYCTVSKCWRCVITMVTGTSLHWLLVESWIFLCFDNFFSNITKNNVFMLKNKSTNELSVELHVENVLIINKKKIWYKIFTFNSHHMYFFVNLRKDITDCNVTVSLAVILVITFQVFTLYYVSDT